MDLKKSLQIQTIIPTKSDSFPRITANHIDYIKIYVDPIYLYTICVKHRTHRTTHTYNIYLKQRQPAQDQRTFRNVYFGCATCTNTRQILDSVSLYILYVYIYGESECYMGSVFAWS